MRNLKIIVWIFSMALLCHSAMAQTTLIGWDFYPPSNDAIEDISIVPNNNKTISCTASGVVGYTFVGSAGSPDNCAWVTGWDNGNASKFWQIELSTFGYTNITVSSAQRSSNTGPRDYKVQYRIGVAGIWTDVPAATVTVANDWTGVLPATALPVACENQSSIYLRWIMTSNISVTAGTVGSTGTSRIDDIMIESSVDQYYQTKATGLWSDTATWEVSTTGFAPWNPAPGPPNAAARTITIRNGHTVTIAGNTSLDETVINGSGVLIYSNGTLTINDGPGIDMAVNGTFDDSGPNSTVFSGSASWILGTNGTYIKTRGTSAAVWRDNYNGGIVNIPASAKWFVRKTGSANPSIVTIGMFYPNLTIENTSGVPWTTGPGSTFAGSTGFALIKGNFDVGGSGNTSVTFINENTNAQPIIVLGDTYVRAGNGLTLNGTGFELQGNLTVDGVVTYGASFTRTFLFSGNKAQTINGFGFPFNIYQFAINKLANNVTLNRLIFVDNNIYLTNGLLITTAANLLIMKNNSIVSAVSNASYVQGPVRKIGDDAFTFPVGKNGVYRPIGISAPAGAGNQFEAEYFQGDPEIIYGNTTAAGIDHVSNCEYWILNRLVGTSNVNVTLSWDNVSCGVTQLADMRVSQWNGALWTDEGNGATTGTTLAGTVTSSAPVTTYGPFTLSSSSVQNPLPVQLIHFSGKYQDKKVELIWHTASEIDSDYFIVERSTDGEYFSLIDKVIAAGFSNSIIAYESIDAYPESGINYYRLKQVDFNGNYSYSDVIRIATRSELDIFAYVDHNNSALIFSVTDNAKFTARIFDTSGKLLIEQEVYSTNDNKINLWQLQSGVYVLQLQSDYKSYNTRFIY